MSNFEVGGRDCRGVWIARYATDEGGRYAIAHGMGVHLVRFGKDINE